MKEMLWICLLADMKLLRMHPTGLHLSFLSPATGDRRRTRRRPQRPACLRPDPRLLPLRTASPSPGEEGTSIWPGGVVYSRLVLSLAGSFFGSAPLSSEGWW